MRRKADFSTDLAEFTRLVATEVSLRKIEGDPRLSSEIGREVVLELPSLPKLGRQIHILRRRIAARHQPVRPAVGFT